MSKENKPRSRKENIVVQEVDGETLIYDLNRNRALCLNPTSAIVWQACDGKRTVADINDLLGKQLQTQTDEDIVWLALDQLSKEKLIEPPVGLENKFGGMSRRQVIKKIGLGSMVALPVVAGLVAPTAALAQTPLPPGSPVGTPLMLAANMCAGDGGGGPDFLARVSACNTTYGMQCTSTMAFATVGGCTDDGAGGTNFTCTCL